MRSPDPPKHRHQFYWQFFFAPLSLAVVAVWSIVANSDTVSNRLIKPFVSAEHWKRWEGIVLTANWHWYVWLIGTLVILSVGGAETGWRLYKTARDGEAKAVSDLENYKTKQLELSWNPTEEPYRWWDKSQTVPALYFRLRLKNICGVTVDGIKVELSELVPRALPCVPCPIRLMNNILPLDTPVRTFSLNPGDKNFIDLLVQSRAMQTFWILHTVQPISVEVPRQAYRLTIRVSAINVPEILRTYELVEDGEMWSMKEVPV